MAFITTPMHFFADAVFLQITCLADVEKRYGYHLVRLVRSHRMMYSMNSNGQFEIPPWSKSTFDIGRSYQRQTRFDKTNAWRFIIYLYLNLIESLDKKVCLHQMTSDDLWGVSDKILHHDHQQQPQLLWPYHGNEKHLNFLTLIYSAEFTKMTWPKATEVTDIQNLWRTSCRQK